MIKVNQNELLDAVDELGTPVLIETTIGEQVVYPDTDDDPYAVEKLGGSGRVYNVEHKPDLNNEKRDITILDWF
jgi:hypothetical protein